MLYVTSLVIRSTFCAGGFLFFPDPTSRSIYIHHALSLFSLQNVECIKTKSRLSPVVPARVRLAEEKLILNSSSQKDMQCIKRGGGGCSLGGRGFRSWVGGLYIVILHTPYIKHTHTHIPTSSFSFPNSIEHHSVYTRHGLKTSLMAQGE
jgi:hypothetical protein